MKTDELLKQYEKQLELRRQYEEAVSKNLGGIIYKEDMNNSDGVKCVINILQHLQENNIEIDKVYIVGPLNFYLQHYGTYISLVCSYNEKLDGRIYGSYSGSSSTQFSDLNTWAEEYLGEFFNTYLNDNHTELFKYYKKDNIDYYSEQLIRDLKMLEKPNPRMLEVIDLYIQYIEKKIKWYNEDEDEEF